MRRPRLTYANVTASLALFVALGGTSYAITKLPKDSVGSLQVRDGSLTARDVAAELRAAGPRGPRGAEGPGGVQGERGPSNVLFAPPAPNKVLSPSANQATEVRRINNVSAGSWVLRFVANAYLPTPQGVHAVCLLRVNGDQRAEGSTVVGNAANATQEAALPIEVAVTQPAPFNVTVECYSNANAGAELPVTIVRAQITATQVAQVTTAP